ncbi:MAG: hypothetical protein RLZZ591_145 [Pseudomonadota bacterium]|jgi:outer membrane lipoprotein LolB
MATKRKPSRWATVLVGGLFALLLSACAQKPINPLLAGSTFWQGRLAIRILSEPVQSNTVAFELRGNADQGSLTLLTPLGSTAAALQWAPGLAELNAQGQVRQFESLQALLVHAIGTELPVSALFAWLAGEKASAPGWQADLQALPEGRLTARRASPSPVVELRVALEP